MKHLLILHGAIGSAAQLQPVAQSLGSTYKVHTLNFSGHGGSPFPAEPLSIPMFAADVLRYIEQQRLETVSVLGYSMGGYVAMYMAVHHPGRIDKIITLATKYQWDEAIATKENQMMNPQKIAEKLPVFAATLERRHAPNDWHEMLTRTTGLMTDMGNDNPLKTTDLAAIDIPVLLLLGDRDKMVSIDETLAVYKELRHAQMGMLPNTPHAIEQVNVALLSFMAVQFFGV